MILSNDESNETVQNQEDHQENKEGVNTLNSNKNNSVVEIITISYNPNQVQVNSNNSKD